MFVTLFPTESGGHGYGEADFTFGRRADAQFASVLLCRAGQRYDAPWAAIFSGYLVESDEGLFDDLSFQINDVSNGRSLFYTRLGDDMRSALAAGHYSTHIGPPVCCGASGNIDGAFIEFEFTFAPSR